MARVNKDNTAEIEPFMTDLLDEKANQFFGRPAYVFQMPDGALLVSDETNGAVYRISYGSRRTASKR
jgi:glucose/arabinose dehydrogenase